MIREFIRLDDRVKDGRSAHQRQREPSQGEDQLNGRFDGVPNKQRAQSRQHKEVEQKAHPPDQRLHWFRRRGNDRGLVSHGGLSSQQFARHRRSFHSSVACGHCRHDCSPIDYEQENVKSEADDGHYQTGYRHALARKFARLFVDLRKANA